MVFVLLTLVVVALFHFVFQGILLPTLRLHRRFVLFSLRDRLRSIRDETLSQEALRYQQDAINNAMRALANLDVFALEAVKRRLNADQALRNRVAQRIAVIESCESAEFQTIVTETLG